MKYKRIIYFCLIFILLAAFTAGCSKTGEPPQPTAMPTATPAPPEELPTVRISELMSSTRVP